MEEKETFVAVWADATFPSVGSVYIERKKKDIVKIIKHYLMINIG